MVVVRTALEFSECFASGFCPVFTADDGKRPLPMRDTKQIGININIP